MPTRFTAVLTCLLTVIGWKLAIALSIIPYPQAPDAYSKDSSLVIRQDIRNNVRVFDGRSDQVIFTFAGHPGWITCYAISPDSKIIAIGTDDGSISLWDARTGLCLQAFPIGAFGLRSIYYDSVGALCLGWTEFEVKCFGVDSTTRLVPLPDGFYENAWRTTCPPPAALVPFDTMPQPLSDYSPQPSYPAQALGMNLRGRVIFRVCISAEGLVRDWEPTKEDPPGYGFAAEVEKVIPHWRFTPALRNGNPVSVWVSVPFNFTPPK